MKVLECYERGRWFSASPISMSALDPYAYAPRACRRATLEQEWVGDDCVAGVHDNALEGGFGGVFGDSPFVITLIGDSVSEQLYRTFKGLVHANPSLKGLVVKHIRLYVIPSSTRGCRHYVSQARGPWDGVPLNRTAIVASTGLWYGKRALCHPADAPYLPRYLRKMCNRSQNAVPNHHEPWRFYHGRGFRHYYDARRATGTNGLEHYGQDIAKLALVLGRALARGRGERLAGARDSAACGSRPAMRTEELKLNHAFYLETTPQHFEDGPFMGFRCAAASVGTLVHRP